MSPGATPPTPFHVITVVWGRPYLELFLDVAVPNQLTPGNLGALPPGSRYRVFTAPEDVETLAMSPVLRRVNELMPVDLVAMPELSWSSIEPLARMSTGHCRALADARDSQAALVFLNADHFMSEGALAAIVGRHAAGSRAVASTGIRLNKDTFVPALQARGAVRGLSSRELVSLALDHLHPFTLAHMVDGTRTARWPISLYWHVRGEGILARAFYLHPLMVDPVHRDVLPKQNFTIDAKYLTGACPAREQVHVVTDSDELCLFELSSHDAAVTEIRAGGISPWRAATLLGRWHPHRMYYWTLPIRIHAGEIGAAWSPVEERSERFAERAKRLRVVTHWLRTTSRRLKPVRRRLSAFRKRLRRAAKALSPARVRRLSPLAARRVQKLRARTAGAGRQMLRRARRSVALFTHSAARPLRKFRKQAARAGRRVLRRARAAQ